MSSTDMFPDDFNRMMVDCGHELNKARDRNVELEGLLRRAEAHIYWLDTPEGEPSDHDLMSDIEAALK